MTGRQRGECTTVSGLTCLFLLVSSPQGTQFSDVMPSFHLCHKHPLETEGATSRELGKELAAKRSSQGIQLPCKLSESSLSNQASTLMEISPQIKKRKKKHLKGAESSLHCFFDLYAHQRAMQDGNFVACRMRILCHAYSVPCVLCAMRTLLLTLPQWHGTSRNGETYSSPVGARCWCISPALGSWLGNAPVDVADAAPGT